jgi:hypothetical protein
MAFVSFSRAIIAGQRGVHLHQAHVFGANGRAIAIDECNNAASTNKPSSMAAARFGTNFL